MWPVFAGSPLSATPPRSVHFRPQMKRQSIGVQTYRRWRTIPLRHRRVRAGSDEYAQSKIIVRIDQRKILRYQPHGDVGQIAERFLRLDAR